jgi:DUF1680 family protein
MAGAEADWRPGDELRLNLPMTPRWTRPDPRIDAVRGCVALERGPLVYCAESTGDLDAVAVGTSAAPEEGRILDTIGLTGTVYPVRTGSGWPYGPTADAASADTDADAGASPITFVPYHRWGNRGPSAMRVWLPERRP